MSLNLGKTWEMLMKGKTEKDQPDPLQYIKHKSNLKLLGVTFEDNPTILIICYPKLVLVSTFCMSANTMGFRLTI